MNILQVVMVGVLSAVLSVTVRKQSPEISLMIAVTASVLMMFMIFPMLIEAVGVLNRMGELLDGGMKYVGLAVKIIGIAYMSELGANVCADAGESAVAARIEMAGRVMVLAAAMPVIFDLINLITGMMPY